MSVRTAQDVADIVAGTLYDLGAGKFENVAATLQDCPVMDKWLKNDKVIIDGGQGIQRTLMTQLSRQASHVSLNADDSTSIPTLAAQLQVPWRRAKTSWAWEHITDILMNQRAGGSKKVFDTLKMRRLDAMQSLAEELEAKAWTCPATTDDATPYGIPYWIVYNATTGFTGGPASGYSTVAGVNVTTHPNFKNYSANYATVTKADLLTKMRSGIREIRWKTGPQDYAKAQQRMVIYVPKSVVSSLETLGEAQNENIGRDLAAYQAGANRDDQKSVDMDGELMFRRYPFFWVPQLDDTSVFTACTNPVYCIDHSTFAPYVLEGGYLMQSDPIQDKNNHNKYAVHIDLVYNYLCVNRRRNAVFATAG